MKSNLRNILPRVDLLGLYVSLDLFPFVCTMSSQSIGFGHFSSERHMNNSRILRSEVFQRCTVLSWSENRCVPIHQSCYVRGAIT